MASTTTRQRTDSSTDDLRWSYALAAVVASGIVFVGALGTVMLRTLHRFHVHAFDLGIFSQGTWLLSRFEWPFFSTIRGLPLFADHSSYILILLAPLYWLFPSSTTLVVVGLVAAVAVGPLAFSVARGAGAGPVLSAVTGVVALMQPALHWQIRDSFHPELLVVPLAVAAIALLQRNRDIWALGAVVLALTAKEDVGLLVVPLGLVVAWVMGKRRVGFTIAGLGAAAFLLNFLVLLPAWSPTGELLYSYRYAALGDTPLSIVAGLLTKPDAWWDVLTDPVRIGYGVALVLSMPLAVLAPRWLLVGLPTLLANIFTGHSYQFSIAWHYTAYLIVAVVLAAAYGAARAERWDHRRATTVAVGVMLVGAAVTWVITGPARAWAPGDSDHPERIRAVLAEIPDDAGVSAWTTFVPHLSERVTVNLFPNPFVEHNYGAQGGYGALGSDVPDPTEVDYVFVRLDSYRDYDVLIADLRASEEFSVVVYDDPFLLLGRTG